MSEYMNYYRAFASMASSGDLCRGGECRGWHLSEVDTWHECGGADCGGADSPHPEAAIEEPCDEAEADEARFAAMGDEVDNRFALDRDLPF